MPNWGVRNMGASYAPPPEAVADARLKQADKPGQHLWVLAGIWAVDDPERPEMLLDGENLLDLTGPGCFKCERQYSRKLARRPCTGTVSA